MSAQLFDTTRFGGARLIDGGSDEGGFEELEEFWFSRALSSATSRRRSRMI